MKRVFLSILSFLILVLSIESFAYSPEISGNYEVGDRTYIDIFKIEADDEEFDEDEWDPDLDTEIVEEIIDQYRYDKLWLRYKQKLSTSDYYYIKGQYNSKEYQKKINYNNLSLDIWTNYTFRINEQLRNKVMIDLRNKDYQNKENNSYNQIRLKYQLDYKVDESNDFTLYLQRQWKDYPKNEGKDNLYDRISFSWDWDVKDNLTVNSKIQYDWTSFKPISNSSNKNSRKYNIGFKWKI